MWAKVQEVFTKEYRREIEYRDFLIKILSHFKLNNQSEEVEKKVKRLFDKKFISQFKIIVEKPNGIKNI